MPTNDPFSSTWRRYWKAGYAPLPLPAGQKKSPPTGFTGGNGKRADAQKLKEWAESSQYENGNICAWFGHPVKVDGIAYQVVGIDVDHYDAKRGGDELRRLEKELKSKLPATWISSARTDGISGIRWFLAPLKDASGKQIEFRGKADNSIEIIQRKHRYAVVWPSVVDGRQYWWFPPAVAITDDGRSSPAAWREDHDLPNIAEFPVLPGEWITYLRNHRTNYEEIDLDISITKLFRWADKLFNDGQADAMCWNIASALATWEKRITENESSHDKITEAHWMLYRLAAEGHTGWKDAVTKIEAHWINNVGSAGKRHLSEAHAEIFRSKTGALRKIKPQVDRDGVAAECTCAGPGANLWHSDKVPLGVAHQFMLANEREDTPIKLWRDDWYQYTGQRWKRKDTDGFRKLIYDRLETATYLTKNGDVLPWNPAQRKVSTVEHALRAAALMDNEDIEAPCWLDGTTDRVIAFQNTLLRIEDRKQIDHTPKYFNLNVLPFDYDPLAPEPVRWKQFLTELWPDDPDSIAALQEWFGYVISGRTNLHKMLTLIGPKRSGKTTIAHVLRSLVGKDNQTGCRSSDFANQFGMGNLIGCTLATFDDDRVTGNGKKFVDVLKDIIGEGQVTIDRKYKEPWQGKLSARFIYIANELSAIPDASGAIVERMIALETRNSFVDNPDRSLRETLEAELPGIFNWALDGLDRLSKQGHFTEPQSSRQLVADLYSTASPITDFIEDKCVWAEDGFVSRDSLFRYWKVWCEENGLLAGSMRSFLSKMRAAFGQQFAEGKRGERGQQQRVLLGLALRLPVGRN